jgi:putative PIN family toxin of toxin-antitoxin system
MTMTSARRFVFDTNTLVSALLLPTSIPRQALDYAFDHGKVLTSPALLRELDRVLTYPKLTPYITATERTQFLGKLSRQNLTRTYPHLRNLSTSPVDISIPLPNRVKFGCVLTAYPHDSAWRREGESFPPWINRPKVWKSARGCV